jgi:hypothetical protein
MFCLAEIARRSTFQLAITKSVASLAPSDQVTALPTRFASLYVITQMTIDHRLSAEIQWITSSTQACNVRHTSIASRVIDGRISPVSAFAVRNYGSRCCGDLTRNRAKRPNLERLTLPSDWRYPKVG